MDIFKMVKAAQKRIEGHAHVTPIMTSHTLNQLIGAQIFLKCENFQRMGAFKFRGAYNASKYAIEGLSDTLRLELKGSNIYISLIEPGPIISQFRANAFKAFKQFINPENSFHQQQYDSMIARLNKPGPAAPFTLGPEAVLKKVIHALESPQPKIRYYVTVPTYLFGYLKRFLSYRMMDKILIKAGGGGKR